MAPVKNNNWGSTLLNSVIKTFAIIMLLMLCTLFILLGVFLLQGNTTASVVTLIVLSFLFFILCLLGEKKFFPVRRGLFICLIAAGLVFRIFYFFIEPDILSDDVYRYLWDGKVQSLGINPYRYPPASEVFDDELKDGFYDKINHKEYKTIYPPLSQVLFLFVYITGGNRFLVLKCLYLVSDLLCAFLLYHQLKKKHRVLIYFLCPLLIVEIYIGMHIDIIGAAFLVCSLYLFKQKKYSVSLLLLACSILIKYVTFGVFFIYCITMYYSDHRRINGKILLLALRIIFFLFAITIFYLPYVVTAGSDVFYQLFFYNQYWEFNSILHPLMRFLCGDSAFILKILLYIAVLGFLSYYRNMTLENKIRLAVLSLFLLNGAFYPWYLVVILPFLVTEMHYAEQVLFFVIQISYIVLMKYRSTGIWENSVIIRAVEYIPFYLVLFYELFRGKYVQRKKNISDYPFIK